MNKIDLKNTSFIIPTRIDSVERLENLEIVCNYLNKYLDTNILVMEHDSASKVPEGNYKKYFYQSNQANFPRNKLFNIGFYLCNTKYAYIYDTDVIFKPDLYKLAIEALEPEHVMLSYPYDGRFRDLLSLKRQVKRELSLDNISDEDGGQMHTSSVGGAIAVNVERYKTIGWENPNFETWAFDDDARWVTSHIMGYQVRRQTGICWHLSHPRNPGAAWYQNGNAEEIQKIRSFNQEQLREYISNWPMPPYEDLC